MRPWLAALGSRSPEPAPCLGLAWLRPLLRSKLTAARRNGQVGSEKRISFAASRLSECQSIRLIGLSKVTAPKSTCTIAVATPARRARSRLQSKTMQECKYAMQLQQPAAQHRAGHQSWPIHLISHIPVGATTAHGTAQTKSSSIQLLLQLPSRPQYIDRPLSHGDAIAISSLSKSAHPCCIQVARDTSLAAAMYLPSRTNIQPAVFRGLGGPESRKLSCLREHLSGRGGMSSDSILSRSWTWGSRAVYSAYWLGDSFVTGLQTKLRRARRIPVFSPSVQHEAASVRFGICPYPCGPNLVESPRLQPA
ncbi:hypothetical protein BD289DRAFT_195916 [Coniella lustricola]|uniref:Uncharacterized protein n=1 Tax=Coniella lustricola TaxID=2025994 RepID=A0A2T3AMA8_9PEZI|nr:hypothetical protein BD289DRAFT_195916 [Coniella lustricola]